MADQASLLRGAITLPPRIALGCLETLSCGTDVLIFLRKIGESLLAEFAPAGSGTLAGDMGDNAFVLQVFEDLKTAVFAIRGQRLAAADKLLAKIRLYVRLSHDLKCLSSGQLEHAARLMDELGRLIGGWQRKQAGPAEKNMIKASNGGRARPGPRRRVGSGH